MGAEDMLGEAFRRAVADVDPADFLLVREAPPEEHRASTADHVTGPTDRINALLPKARPYLRPALDGLDLEVRRRRGEPGEPTYVEWVGIASDRPAWPTITLGPAVDGAASVLTAVQGVAIEARRRMTAACSVLRWGTDAA